VREALGAVTMLDLKKHVKEAVTLVKALRKVGLTIEYAPPRRKRTSPEDMVDCKACGRRHAKRWDHKRHRTRRR
jgi:hypothetical protein